jgi:hypothetical protein
MRILASFAALALASTAAAAEAPPPQDRDFRVTDIQARLLLEQSGALSVDIADNDDFIGWNTIIGEGSAGENADDLLVTAIVTGPGEHNLTTPLILTARDEMGRVLGRRRIAGIFAKGRSYRSMLLHDVGCAGTIRLTAQLGTSTRTETVSLPCGE